MNIQKINWKIFLSKNSSSVSTDDLFRIFNNWIKNDNEEIFIDVADYSHCHGGTKVILAGHYAHYYWDETDGDLGLLYSRVKHLDMANSNKITVTLKSFLNRLKQFQEDDKIANKVQFDPRRLQFAINDRALAFNTEESFKKVAPLLTTELQAFSGTQIRLKHLTDIKRLFRVEISFQNELF